MPRTVDAALFARGGTGYVPSEAVGAIFLKPLDDAIEDGDRIYGTIEGTAVSHGGRTNGYTVPNPVSQSLAIEEALIRSQVDPRTIGFVEAHGTGTALGDPIEIAGLTDVFEKYTRDQGFCSISSVKSNIGHAEGAAGIAQVTKVLLQLQHRTLVKNVMHGKGLNPNIDFQKTPFKVQQSTEFWPRPIIDGREFPRRAGISSFGAGGANAHILIKEYIHPSKSTTGIDLSSATIVKEIPHAIVLSAKNEERLQQIAANLLDYLARQETPHLELLPNMAYTLQVGREGMEKRLAVTVESVQELQEKLTAFLAGSEPIEKLYRGEVKRNRSNLYELVGDGDLEQIGAECLRRRDYSKLLQLWVNGLAFDWNELYPDRKPERISLPTYPFAKNRYWVETEAEGEVEAIAGEVSEPVAIARTNLPPAKPHLHPLLQENTSDFEEQRFTSVFGGQEFFLRDHVVKQQRVLPGVAYLEMARAAVERSVGDLNDPHLGIGLKNVVWVRPVAVVDKPVEVRIGLFPEVEENQITYEIYSQPEDSPEPVIHSQGKAVLQYLDTLPDLDLPALQSACNRNYLDGSQCYEAFQRMGMDYGPGHRGIEGVFIGSGQLLAKLSLPESVSDTRDRFFLHPSLMDGALQASVHLMGSIGDLKPALPFILQELEIYSPCLASMWAWIRHAEGCQPGDKVQKFDIDLTDDLGRICARMKGFSARVLEREVSSSPSSPSPWGTLLLGDRWEERAIPPDTSVLNCEARLVILCELDGILPESLERRMNGVPCLSLQLESPEIGQRFEFYATRVFEEIQRILEDKPKGKILIQFVYQDWGEQKLFSGLFGLLKTAQLEHPKLIGQLVGVELGEDGDGLAEKLEENRTTPTDIRVRYRGGKRWIAVWNEIDVPQKASIPWQEGGVYLITGGAGGLGRIFTKEAIEQTRNATLILTGRSPLTPSKQAQLKEWEDLGARILYERTDITQEAAIAASIRKLVREFGNLNGIIHAAGIIRDNFIRKKTKAEFESVLLPKVSGSIYLDRATRDLPLDFLILFSSTASGTGNPGQADYCTANSFMDAYARYRNELVAAKQRQGQTLAINWPLWKSGGMQVDPETEKLMRQSLGLVPMNTSTGIEALYRALASRQDRVMVMVGEVPRIKQKLSLIPNQESKPKEMPASEPSRGDLDANVLLEKVQGVLMGTVAKVIGIGVEDLDLEGEFTEYGFDSISLTQLTNELNENYDLDMTPAIFFEYTDLSSFAEYLSEEYPNAFAP